MSQAFLRRGLGQSPPLRRLARVALRLTETAGFALWRVTSQMRFGQVRWVTVYDGQHIAVRTDDYRAYRVVRCRGSQKAKIAVWRRLAALNPAVCVDVGANYGEFSRAIVETGLPIVIIEPNPRLIDPLQATFHRWKNVQVLRVAIADEDGTVSLFFNPRESGSASLSRAPVPPRPFLGRYQIKKHEVPARRLAGLIVETVGAPPASVILKVDVEGFERAVLQGAIPLLKRAVWWRALVEFNPEAIRRAGDDPQGVWTLLREYKGVLVSEDALANRDLAVLNSSLSLEQPQAECDVVIGEGLARPPASLSRG